MSETDPIILASSSPIRAELLRRAGVSPLIVPARVDEEALRQSLAAAGAHPRDMAAALAEAKATKVSRAHPGRLVVGADQILALGTRVCTKAETREEAEAQLRDLSGRRHTLHTAAVACLDGRPVWRHVGQAGIVMHELSDAFVADYLDRRWEAVRHSVGCYLIEEDGVRLMAAIEGDYFHILGLPLIELLTWLRIRGDIAT